MPVSGKRTGPGSRTARREWYVMYVKKHGDPKTNSFITGCKSYKLDNIVKHEQSKNHEKSMLMEKTKT